MRTRLLVPPAALVLALVGCGDGTSSTDEARSSEATGAGGVTSPLAAASSHGVLIADPNHGGTATRLALDDIRFGRAVELWSRRADGSLVRVTRDFVIGADHTGDGVDTWLVTQPVLGLPRLLVDADVEDVANGGRRRFIELAAAASATTEPVSDAGVDAMGNLTSIPRNAALELRFTDLVDTSTLVWSSVKLLVGEPTVIPFELRIVPSGIHGGIDNATGEFAPTRVVLPFATREIDLAYTYLPMAVNATGVPPAVGQGSNAALRLSTAGSIVRNLSGAPLVPTGSVDLGSASQDMVRPFRTGGTVANGFLPDTEPPRLVARADTEILDAPQQSLIDPLAYRLPRVRFASKGCAGPPSVGDIVRQTGVLAEVTAPGGPATNGVIRDVQVRLLEFPSSWTGPEQWATDGVGAAIYDAPYETTMDAARVACLIEVSPTPLGAPNAPTRGISPSSNLALFFNEPISPDSVNGLEAIVVGATPISAGGHLNPAEPVVAELFLSASMEILAHNSIVPLAHTNGEATRYWLTPRVGAGAAHDLAGNALEESPGPIAMSVDPSAPTANTGGRLWTFSRPFQSGPNGFDWAGQLRFDPADQYVAPRPVVRFRESIDRSNPVLAQQIAFPQGVHTPLNPLGAKLQTVWRYCDMGLELTDPDTANIDVEGLWWSPTGGQVLADSFSEFEIELKHSRFAQDEVIDPQSLFPRFQNSGFREAYDVNEHISTTSDPAVVHPRHLGYDINPGDLETTPNGHPIMPFPQNRVAGEPRRTYTWRDTEIRERGGVAIYGVEPMACLIALGIPIPSIPYYRTGEVQSLGLPLLMQFSTWPDPNAIGLNAFDVNLAINSSSRPFFRAFSAGGVDINGNTVVVDPEFESSANGGYNPNSNPPGQRTYGRDNTVYMGAADFVVRKSVAHSFWVDAGSDSLSRQFLQPIVGLDAEPAGTSVRVDGRLGASVDYLVDNDLDTNGVVDYLEDARTLDLYGDFYAPAFMGHVNHDSSRANPGLSFFVPAPGTLDEWRSDISAFSGARFVQLRIAFESNIVTGERPAVSAVGVAWRD